ncbi:Piso0_003395 [Millerozyma farinosa CBS 7064]|uniref:Piso0_003395 protein n=1 Tax=Pichia sorbitophila (strain ATCC MYA-4447 / BCRC 22081 / CBS 7064 / NBRC 10061 / NRRL Y-12695) TaxID=559304 RepID=G8YHZ5_PICSO|nr:Piso0_003395 [Millerozyma farinosa CBS 7064]CCE81047.1 Piso0_003395 [Millerozyma farinosa CBS 7064]
MMRQWQLVLAAVLLLWAGQGWCRGMEVPARQFDSKRYFVVEIDTAGGMAPLGEFIREFSDVFSYEHPVRGLDDHFVFSIDKAHPHSECVGNWRASAEGLMRRADGFEQTYDRLATHPHIRSIEMLPPKRLAKRRPVPFTAEEVALRSVDVADSSQLPVKEASERLGINDPVFVKQWHLINTFYPGHDVNVTGLWYEGIMGNGSVTAIVDDGLDYESRDLADNFNQLGSWDFNDNGNLPKPRLSNDYHGTRCAGEVAAVRNDICGVGVAYGSQVSGIRILSKDLTAEEEAAALMYGLEVNDIFSCSWGPTDDGRTLSQPELVVKKAIVKGIQTGRKNKGAIYVFASGNGGFFGDSCNYDGYTNSIYSITVGAIDYKGIHPSYAESCSAVMVVTYSSGSGEHIHTTDLKGTCASGHGGTSAAAPLAAGIYALVLQVNPNLTWRDLQYVSVLSTTPVNIEDGSYQKTALGRQYSHKYGYGKIDAYKMAHFARNWKNVKPQAWYYSDIMSVGESISANETNNDAKIVRSINIPRKELEAVNVERVEHVTVTVNIASDMRGKIGVSLKSPLGVVSTLGTYRRRDASSAGLKDWTFMSVAHWGEPGDGEWEITVTSDGSDGPNQVEFIDWQLRLFGESIDEKRAETFNITKDYAAVRRSLMTQPHTQIPTSTTSAVSSTALSSTIAASSVAASSSASSSASAAPSEPAETTEPDDDDGKNTHYTTSHAGQYFMALAVLGFIVVVLVMKFHKTPGSIRRRRRHEEYEFDIIPGEDYTDSDDDLDSDGRNSRDRQQRHDDSFDLGFSRQDDPSARLFEQPDSLGGTPPPDYDHIDRFAIGDEPEEHTSGRPDSDPPSTPSGSSGDHIDIKQNT